MVAAFGCEVSESMVLGLAGLDKRVAMDVINRMNPYWHKLLSSTHGHFSFTAVINAVFADVQISV